MQFRIFLIFSLLLIPTTQLPGQEAERFGPIQIVSYRYEDGHVSQVLSCQQPVPGLPPALCWIVRVSPVAMVDGKPNASKFAVGRLSISASKVLFNSDDHLASRLDLPPESATLRHSPGKPYAVLAAGSASYVIMPLSVCLSCPPNQMATALPDSPVSDRYFNDLAESLAHLDVVLKRISDIAAQASTSQTAPVGGGVSETVDSGEAQGHLLSHAPPVYPDIAKAAKITGTVFLSATILKDGSVDSPTVVSGPVLLQAAALDAVRQWKYRPVLINSVPVEVQTQMNVVFTLGGMAAPGGAPQP